MSSDVLSFLGDSSSQAAGCSLDAKTCEDAKGACAPENHSNTTLLPAVLG